MSKLVINSDIRKNSLPRTGKVLDAIGSTSISSSGGGTSGGGSAVIEADFDILAGNGIDIGKNASGKLTYTVSHGDTSNVESTSNYGNFLISNLIFDGMGHVLDVESVNAAQIFDDRYLRKDIDDTAHGIITFDKDIRSTVFLDGYDGKGWEIKENGTAWLGDIKARNNIFLGNKFGSPSFAAGFAGWGTEIDIPSATGTFDNIFVRKEATFYTITYSQIYGLGGSQTVSDINKIASVEVMSDRFRCYMDSMDGLMLMNLRVGDGARIQNRVGTTSIKYLFGRIINITSDYFDIAKPLIEGTGEPEAGDFVLRWGNDRDKNRQGLIYLTTADQGAPFIAVYDGITGVSTKDTLKVQLGNLSDVRTTKGVQLSGYGGYFNGIYVENSSVILDNGMTVEQQFTVMNGEFNSAIEGLKNDMSLEAGNILRNSSFSNNTNYWIADNVVHFINVDGKFLWMDGSFYVEKNAVADIYRDGNKNVLRVLNTTIRQYNDVMTGDKPEGTYSFTFFAKVLRAGTLTAGFSGKDLFVQQQMTASDSYQKISKAANWDGQGDFSIGFTGEILIYGVSLFNDALSDAVIKLQTQIMQNAEEIKLSATKEYVNQETNKIYTKYDTSLSLKADKAELNSFRDEYNEFGQVVRRDYATQTWTANKINSEVGTIVDGKLTNYSTISQTNSAINLAVKDLASKTDLRLTSEGLQLSIKNVDSKANSAQNTANTAQGTADSAKNVADKNSLVTSAFYSFDSLRMRLNRRIEMGSGSNDNFTCRAGLSPDTTGPAFWAGSTWENRANSAIRLGHDGAGWLAKKNIMWDTAGNTQYTGKVTSNNDGNRIIIDPSTRSLKMYNSSNQEVANLSWITDSGVSYPTLIMRIYAGSVETWKTVLSPGSLSFSFQGVYQGGFIGGALQLPRLTKKSQTLKDGTIYRDDNNHLIVDL